MRGIGGKRETSGKQGRQNYQVETGRNPAAYCRPIAGYALTTKIIKEVKLPAIKLELFAGIIETSSRFREQFESSVDKNPSVSTINKHVFLRGYLEGSPSV